MSREKLGYCVKSPSLPQYTGTCRWTANTFAIGRSESESPNFSTEDRPTLCTFTLSTTEVLTVLPSLSTTRMTLIRREWGKRHERTDRDRFRRCIKD